MFSYENGLIVSFLFYCYYLVSLVMTINSKAERNLNKVGETHSWLSLKPGPMSKSDFNRPLYKSILKFLIIAIWQGLFVFLSWINVVINIFVSINRYIQDKNAPKEVKEFRWRMRNFDLTFDEIILELIKIKGYSIDDFDNLKLELEEFVNNKKNGL